MLGFLVLTTPKPCPLCCCRTVKLVQQSGLADRVIRAGRGRALQMNEGAAAAKGDLLCFLHADTQPPPDLVGLRHRLGALVVCASRPGQHSTAAGVQCCMLGREAAEEAPLGSPQHADATCFQASCCRLHVC